MKRFLLIFLTFVFVGNEAFSQTTAKIKELENRRNELQQQITESETLLRSTKKDVKSQLDNLALITGQIEKRKQYLEVLQADVNALNAEITSLGKQLAELEKELNEKKENYQASVQYMYKNRSVQEKLMFIFSAKNFNQMYRRMRYVRQYADFQRVQGKEIEGKQQQVNAKKEELETTKSAKETLLKQGEAERARLQIQERDRQTLVANLQKKQRGIQQEINKKRQTAQQLNRQIDKLIEEEVAKARKRAEEEARKKAAEEAKAKQANAKANTKSNTPTQSKEVKKAAPVEKFNLNTEDRRLSGNFERNRGILPMPITGPYVIVSHYGAYTVDGLKYVKLDNKGIDIKGKAGAQARAIFDGEVSVIFKYNGLNNVLIRHGAYISVYCNLSTVNVQKGSKVNTRDVIGAIATDTNGNTVLHFQLRKETAKLNPELWLGR
ncbi:MAG: peptidoglycan DD-metalloendopeptidase family protein [Phocaeicola sp.]|nr:peptidoglycan DD-metalloendopeptidase family protein [Phocaeicola sp.]